MTRTRALLGTLGVLLVGYGGWRILTTARLSRPADVGEWLLGALILHDGVLAPAVAAFGVAAHRLCAARAPRAAGFLAGAFVAAAMVVVVAVPLIQRRGRGPAGSTLETRNYVGGLAVVLGIVAATAVFAYALSILRERRSPGPRTRGPRRASDR
jgi:hypothetical protein